MNTNFQLLASSVMTLALVGCNSSNEESVPPTETPKVIFTENFEQTENGQLPEGWDLITNFGEAYVQDGHLYLDGTVDDYSGTTISMPQELAGYSDYRIDIDFTIDEANSPSRWVGFKYRISGNEPYYHMAIRQNAMAGNGTELTFRYNNSWNILDTASYKEDIDAEKSYTATIIAYGRRVQHLLDGELMHDSEIINMFGELGMQAAGSKLKVNEITVTERLSPLPELEHIYDIQEPETNVAMAPTLIQPIENMDDMWSMKVSNALMYLQDDFSLTNDTGDHIATLEELLAADIKAIPVIYLSERMNIAALGETLSKTKSLDLTFVSSSQAQLTALRSAAPNVRSALDMSHSDIVNLNDIVSQTTMSKSRIVILSAADIDRESMAYLHRRLLTVWINSDVSSRPADLLTSGAHGILTTATEPVSELLSRFPENTLLRKPLVIGHRGVPSLLPENTLESAVKAVELGVDGNEYDVFLSADGHIVVMHDSTVDRTTDGEGRIEEMTLEEIRALNILDLDGSVTSMKVPTLEEFFAEFIDEDMTHFLEIKSDKPEIIDTLKALLEEYPVAEQLIVIAFSEAQAARMGEVLPEIPTGLLIGHSNGNDDKDTLKRMLKKAQPLSTTYNPSYSDLQSSVTEIAKHRGMTMWPWTYRDESHYYRDYIAGIHGLTTDYVQWSSDFTVEVTPLAFEVSTQVGEKLTVATESTTQVGDTETASMNEFLVVSSSAEYTQTEEGGLLFSSPGQAEVLVRFTQPLPDDSFYRIFSQPISVTIE
ncbi:glycerophosphodiester phosphodiesterase family protein [Vibrio sp. FNV 38]|nr:glycerophosphodiester phosphodiesterase family protein [Vibrio sp. FNV 38]